MRGRALVEISGGVTLERMPEIAATGADFVSIGALTHSARAADLSFELEPPMSSQTSSRSVPSNDATCARRAGLRTERCAAFATIGSIDARDEAAGSRAAEGDLVVAEEQTAGRGRRGRHGLAAGAGLYFLDRPAPAKRWTPAALDCR